MYDVIIIGGGPAGLTAAIYTSRRALKTLVLTRDIGGQVSKTLEVENYPGVDSCSGIELATKMKNQAASFGAEIKYEEAKKFEKNNDFFEVNTTQNTFKTKTVIVATGKKPRELDVPGEEEFKGRGVSYCATCDAPFFRNKVVTVVGGSNSALEAAILSSEIASKVYVVHRSSFSGEQVLINKLKTAKNVEILLEEEIVKINGDSVVRSIELKSGKKIETDGIIVEIGYKVDRSIVEKLLEMNENNQIIVNNKQETSLPGVFAAGDLTTTIYKQIVIAAGEGAKAALSAYDFIMRSEGKKGISGDWQKLNKNKKEKNV